MDTIAENKPVDTSLELLEKRSAIRFSQVRWEPSPFITGTVWTMWLIMIFWCLPVRKTALPLLPEMA